MPEPRKYEDLTEPEQERFLDFLDDGLDKAVAEQVAAKRAKAPQSPAPVA